MFFALLESLLRELSLCDVAGYAGKKALTILCEFSERKFERYFSSVFAQSGKLHALPRHVTLAGRHIAFQPRAMNMPQVFGHDHGERLSNQFITRVTESFFRSLIRKQNRTVHVDRDDRVG